ncbi:hypothetical protein SN15_02335, partial [Stenotrophomonas maltophilia]
SMGAMGTFGSADPWSADLGEWGLMVSADHGSALPLFFFFIRGWRPRNLSWVGRGGYAGP